MKRMILVTINRLYISQPCYASPITG